MCRLYHCPLRKKNWMERQSRVHLHGQRTEQGGVGASTLESGWKDPILLRGTCSKSVNSPIAWIFSIYFPRANLASMSTVPSIHLKPTTGFFLSLWQEIHLRWKRDPLTSLTSSATNYLRALHRAVWARSLWILVHSVTAVVLVILTCVVPSY